MKQSIQLYPTSGTSQDYAYGRSFVIPESPRVYAYTLETGTEFQPTYQKAIIIMFEVAAGLVQFCLEYVCAVTELMQSAELASADAAPLSDRVIIAQASDRSVRVSDRCAACVSRSSVLRIVTFTTLAESKCEPLSSRPTTPAPGSSTSTATDETRPSRAASIPPG